VNAYTDGGGDPQVEASELDPGIADRQIARTRQRVSAREGAACARTLSRLRQDADEGHNVMPALVEAARAGATVGEMAGVFRQAFGEFREPSPW
jgi:methylmalonyl-CoA mutase N-terminal domain/subunit